MARYRGRKIRMRRRGVIRLRLRQLLRDRGVTAYALSKYTGLSLNTSFKPTRSSGCAPHYVSCRKICSITRDRADERLPEALTAP